MCPCQALFIFPLSIISHPFLILLHKNVHNVQVLRTADLLKELAPDVAENGPLPTPRGAIAVTLPVAGGDADEEARDVGKMERPKAAGGLQSQPSLAAAPHVEPSETQQELWKQHMQILSKVILKSSV